MSKSSNSPESVYFFTLHKCASSLFGSYVLKNINGLEHINYAGDIFAGKNVEVPLVFHDTGFVYGPIRISSGPRSWAAKELVAPTCKPGFIQNRIAVILIRDPRDILVSQYFSIGFTHGHSPVKKIRERQEANRQLVRAQGIDEYVIDNAPIQVERFDRLGKLAADCHRSVLLRYEDMVNDFDSFALGLSRFLELDESVLEQIYIKSRPKTIEDVTAHKRSGKVGGFSEKLRPDTIQSLNIVLHKTLDTFAYL